MLPGNLFTEIPADLSESPEELLTPLLSGRDFRMERIVSHGQASPPGFWYDQEEEEWVLLLQGAAQLEFDERPPQDLVPGDHLLIPAHQKHRVAWTTPQETTIWLAVFFK